MVYLKEFNLLSEEFENGILINERRNYFHNQYPFRIFTDKKLEKIDFTNITILYGGNGSGKSTILNIIAEKLNAKGLNFTGGEMFQTYVDYCKYETSLEIPDEVKAPVKKGETVGRICYRISGKEIGSVNLIASTPVEKADFGDYLKKIWKKLL